MTRQEEIKQYIADSTDDQISNYFFGNIDDGESVLENPKSLDEIIKINEYLIQKVLLDQHGANVIDVEDGSDINLLIKHLIHEVKYYITLKLDDKLKLEPFTLSGMLNE